MVIDELQRFNKAQDKSDKKISNALMASFVILTIQYFILIYFGLIDTSTGHLVQLSSKGLVGLAYLYALPSVVKRSLNNFIAIYFLGIFIFLLHYFVFPENRPYIVTLVFPFFSMCLPAFIYSISIRDFQVFKLVMKQTSYIVFCTGLLIGVLVFTGITSVGSYSMALSYYMLLPTIIFIDELMDRFSFKMLVFTALSLLIILSLGSRGAMLCIVVFGSLKFIRPNSKRTYKRVIGNVSLVSIAVITLVFLEQIMMSLYNFLFKFGINSRTLILFFRTGVDLSGRDYIYENVIAEILKNPILGLGIAGDRRVGDGTYVHNLFIEIIGNFGIIFGFLVCLCLIYLVIKAFLIKNIENYNIVIIWFSLGFVHLFVSSSYLIDMRFWIFLGVIVNFFLRRKSQNT